MIFDLVIPCYNPPPNWEKQLYKKFQSLIDSYFEGDSSAIHLILVNDGSCHNFSSKEVKYLQEVIPSIEVISYTENKGKGYALREGVKRAFTPYCIYSDYDFPFGLKAVFDIYQRLRNGIDIVTGSREAGNYHRKISLKRKVISNGLIGLNNFLFRLPVKDTQAGIKGFNQKGRYYFLQTSINRFLFDLEFVYLASQSEEVEIEALAVTLTDDITLSDFSMKTVVQETKNLLKILAKRYGKRKENIVQYRPGRI